MSNEPVAPCSTAPPTPAPAVVAAPPPAAPPKLPTSMVFIDGTNLDRVCEDRFGRNDIDFAKMLPAVSRGTELLHTFYVTAPYRRGFDDTRLKVQTGMINHLKRLPNVTVDLQEHRMREQWCSKCRRTSMVPKEKGTDVAVGAYLVEQAVLKAADQMILVANDTDYGPTFKVAKRYGRATVLACVFGNYDKEFQIKVQLAALWHQSNRIVRMDLPFFSQCWMQP